jgi:hypothetical protein
MYFTVNMVFDNPNVVNPTPLTIGPTTTIRCDSEAYFKPTKRGCAYNLYSLSTLYLSTTDPAITEAAKFIAAAQKAIPNHVGVRGTFQPLTRTTSKSKRNRNRRVACKGVRPKTGQSCDEYPFATTNQGAAQVKSGYYKAEALNAKQNSKVGTLLSTFLLQNRILDGDPYYVKVTT